MILLLQRSYAKRSMRWKQRSEDMQVKPAPQHSMHQPARHLPVLQHPHRLLPLPVLRHLRRLLPLPLPLTVQTCGERSTAHPNSRHESRHHLRCHRLHPHRPSHDVCVVRLHAAGAWTCACGGWVDVCGGRVDGRVRWVRGRVDVDVFGGACVSKGERPEGAATQIE